MRASATGVQSLIALAFIAAVFIALLGVGCIGEESSQRPTFQPIPTPTPPSDLVTYTDEGNSFKISYPSEWTVDTALTESVAADAIEIVSDVFGQRVVAQMAFLFLAGTSDGDLSISVGIDANQGWKNVDGAVDGNIIAFETLESWQLISRTKTELADRPAVIITSTYDAAELDPELSGTTLLSQGLILDGDVYWVVTCGKNGGTASDLLSCNAAMRTFELLHAS